MLDQYVRVRLVQGNSLDLNLFQFDYDLTFAVFFLNADGTIYGRYGSRSEGEHAEKEITLQGFAKALEAALTLHRGYPKNKEALAGKRGKPARFKIPEEYPSLAGRYKPTLDYDGKLVQSCIHCHQVREAERLVFRQQNQPLPEDLLFPWPMPDVVGLDLDPGEVARVHAVLPDSPASQAGFRAGDDILRLNRQPIISIADVQWVLESAKGAASIDAEIRRNGQLQRLSLRLPEGWRRKADISWRPTTWDLRRMVTGGLVLKTLSPDVLKEKGLSPEGPALVVDYVGQYNDHAAGKRAGFQKGDIIASVDGQKAPLTEGEFISKLIESKKKGDRASVEVLRSGQKLKLDLPMQ